jgi:hypothetical protein
MRRFLLLLPGVRFLNMALNMVYYEYIIKFSIVLPKIKCHVGVYTIIEEIKKEQIQMKRRAEDIIRGWAVLDLRGNAGGRSTPSNF